MRPWHVGNAVSHCGFTIVPLRDSVCRLEGVRQAVKVDTPSIVAFQVGLFGWMALSHFVLSRRR